MGYSIQVIEHGESDRLWLRSLEPGTSAGEAPYAGQYPYRGLRVFDGDDAAFFFGRESRNGTIVLESSASGQTVERDSGISNVQLFC